MRYLSKGMKAGLHQNFWLELFTGPLQQDGQGVRLHMVAQSSEGVPEVGGGGKGSYGLDLEVSEPHVHHIPLVK